MLINCLDLTQMAAIVDFTVQWGKYVLATPVCQTYLKTNAQMVAILDFVLSRKYVGLLG